MDKKTPHIAVLGAGYWGKNHVRVFHELGALAVVVDIDPETRAWVQTHYPDVEVTSEVFEVWKREDIQGVVIATPAKTHYELALQALQAGKDVLVEKPLALHVNEAQHLVAEAQRLKRILMVGHVLEYHPAVQKLYELIKNGVLGKIRYLYSNRLNWGKFRTEENILWSFAPHDVALMLRIMGTLPEEVIAQGESYLNEGIADVTLTTLRFPGKVLAHIFVSWLHPFKEQRFVVVGDKQIAVFEDTQPWEEKLVLYSHEIEWKSGRIPVARKDKGEPVPIVPAEPLKMEAKAFLESLQTRQPPLTDGESALRVLRVLQAAQESLDKNGEKQRLEQPARKYFIHPTAIVDDGAVIGEGSKIWHFSHIMPGARIGKNCIIGQNVFVGRNVRIGDGVKIQNNVSVYEGVELEDFVFCGPSVVFTNVINPRSEIERKHEFRKTLVRRGATLGANSTIICGVTIGQYAFVGAGAVVTKDVPDYALVVGVPARIVGWMCVCGQKLPFSSEKEEAQCNVCGRHYRKEGLHVRLIK